MKNNILNILNIKVLVLAILSLASVGLLAQPPAPPNLKVVQPYYNAMLAMHLEWDPVAGAQNYEVRRKVDAGAFGSWDSLGVVTSYTDNNGINAASTYTYEVRVKVGGVYSASSNARSNKAVKMWPVTKTSSCSAAESIELLHGYNQPIMAGGSHYLHEGNDIHGEESVDGECVRAPMGGVVASAGGSGSNIHVDLKVRLNGNDRWFNFNHLRNLNAALVVGESVEPGTKLGEITSTVWSTQNNHTHVSLWGDYANRDAQRRPPLEAFDSNSHRDPKGNAPVVENTNASDSEPVRFRKGPNQTDYLPDDGKVYKEVDIVVEARDHQTADAPWQVPKNVGYYVQKVEGGTVTDVVRSAAAPYLLIDGSKWFGAPVGNTPASRMNTLRDPAATLESSAGTPAWYAWDQWFTYIVTNTDSTTGDSARLDADQCWATDAKYTETKPNGYKANYDTAAVNDSAKFKDGNYRVRIRLADFVNTAADHSKDIMVDNFRPYVKKVTVESGGEMLYQGAWTFDGTNLKYGPDTDPNNNMNMDKAANGDADVKISIEFSEPMKEAEIVKIEPLGYKPILHSTDDTKTKWEATIPKDALKTTQPKNGRQLISIKGKDIADNEILQINDAADIDPNAKITRRGDGTLNGTGGIDKLHRFAIVQKIAFVIDDTGSMWEEIAGVKAELQNTVNNLDNDPDVFPEYYLITFKDYVDFRGKTQDKATILAWVNSLSASGGDECPESSVEALASLTGHMPKGGTAILATDASPSAGLFAVIITKIQLFLANIKVNTILTGDCPPPMSPGFDNQGGKIAGESFEEIQPERGSKPWSGGGLPGIEEYISGFDAFSQISEETGGQFFFITDFYFTEAFQVVVSDLQLSSQVAVRDASNTQSYTVAADSTISDISFNLKEKTGASLSFSVQRPDGTPLNSSDPDVTYLSGANFEFYRVSAPEVGNWTPNITGSGDFTLDISGDTPVILSLNSSPVWAFGVPENLQVALSGDSIASATFNLIALDGALITTLSLFDDGAHNDFGAGDGIYGGTHTPALDGRFRLQAMGVFTSGQSFIREDRKVITVEKVANIQVSPLSLQATQELGDTTTQTLAIQNTGSDTLIFQVVEVPSDTVPSVKMKQAPVKRSFGQSYSAAPEARFEDAPPLQKVYGVETAKQGEPSHKSGSPLIQVDILDSLFYDSYPPLDFFTGFGSAVPFWAAGRFTPTNPFVLTHVRTYYRTQSSTAAVELRVYAHNSATGSPGTVLLSQTLSGSDYLSAAGKEFLIPLSDSVSFSAGEEFWIGFGFQNVPHPQGTTDEGVNQTGRARYSGDGSSWFLLGDLGGNGVDDAWIIRALSAAREDIPWLTITPDQGQILPGGSMDLTVQFTTAGITSDGVYQGGLHVQSNDPDEGLLRLPVQLTVSGCAPDGDVNEDGSITPADALLAMEIYLGAHTPAGCEFITADVNCSNAVTPGDALTIFYAFLGTPIPPCGTLTKTAGNVSEVFAGDVSGTPGDTISVPIWVDNPEGISAFGLDLRFPEEQLEFLGIAPSLLTREWITLKSSRVSEDVIRLGGFNTEAIASAAAASLVEIRFRVRSAENGAGRLEIFNLTDDLANFQAAAGAFNQGQQIPERFALHQNYPNPFNPETTIRFDIPRLEGNSVKVRISIYNISGQLVRRLIEAEHTPGAYAVKWDGRNESGNPVASGVYFYTISAGNFSATQKMLMVK